MKALRQKVKAWAAFKLKAEVIFLIKHDPTQRPKAIKKPKSLTGLNLRVEKDHNLKKAKKGPGVSDHALAFKNISISLSFGEILRD